MISNFSIFNIILPILLSLKSSSKTASARVSKKLYCFFLISFFIKNSSITGQVLAIDSGQSLNWQTPDIMRGKE